MDISKKLFIGYDLCEDATRISIYSYKAKEPISISSKEGEEDGLIPTALCVKADTKQWLYGEEAISCATAGEGVLINHLLAKLTMKEETEVFGQKFTAVQLMEKYLRKTLSLVKNYFPNEPITKMVVAIPNTIPLLVEGIYSALSLLGIEKDRVIILSHPGAFLYYILNQDKLIWMNDVGLFDFNEAGLTYYQMSINRRTKPMIAGLSKAELTPLLTMDLVKSDEKNAAYVFETIAGTVLYKQIISTLFFTGNGFGGNWADGVLRKLCTGRRVFQGQNLYTKGACYAARELTEDKCLGEFLILNDDMITSSVGISVFCDTKYRDLILAEVGEVWYEVQNSIEVIPDGESELEITIKKIMSREVIRRRISLEGLWDRPNRMTRLEINLSCSDKNTALFEVKDLGFGELYPKTGHRMEFKVEL